ncbi:amidohydrolase family protein [Patescibacteria group bacterium]
MKVIGVIFTLAVLGAGIAGAVYFLGQSSFSQVETEGTVAVVNEAAEQATSIDGEEDESGQEGAETEEADSGEETTTDLVVDTHMHIFPYVRAAGKDIKGAVANMLDTLDTQGVDRAMLMTVPSKVGQSTEADEQDTVAAASISDRLYYMGGGSVLGVMMQETDPADVTDEVKQEFRDKAVAILDDGAVGFGEMLLMHLCLTSTHSYQYVSPTHPLFLELADIAAEYDVPIEVHMEAVLEDKPMLENLTRACAENPETMLGTINDFKELLAHNPDTRIVWQHIGWDNVGDMTIPLLRELMTENTNLYLSLKVEARPVQVQTRISMPNRLIDEQGNLRQQWIDLFEDYTNRFMIGADEFIPATGADGPGAPSFGQTWSMANQLPDSVRSEIIGENAARVYKLD